jgi:Recombination endonuclease VII
LPLSDDNGGVCVTNHSTDAADHSVNSDPATTKKCSKCGEEKDLGEFGKDKQSKSGLSPRCKKCQRKRHKKWRLDNPGKHNEWAIKWQKANPERHREKSRKWMAARAAANPEKQREYNRRAKLARNYGTTPEQVDAIVVIQGGGCSICGIKLDGKTKNTIPHVYHCHATGVIRGILCGKHNTAEGLLGSIENARRMVAYMEKNALFYSSAKAA